MNQVFEPSCPAADNMLARPTGALPNLGTDDYTGSLSAALLVQVLDLVSTTPGYVLFFCSEADSGSPLGAVSA